METLSIKEFRKRNGCDSCLYSQNMKRCFMTSICPLVIEEENVQIKRTCPLDESGTCPYKNGAGTCFAFCWKEILKDYKEAKVRSETEEEKDVTNIIIDLQNSD